MATAIQVLETSQPQGVRRKFTVELSEALAVSLQEWFVRAGRGEVGDIDSFFAEVATLPIIEFRLDDLPPTTDDGARLVREKMTAARKVDLFDLFDSGDECNPAVLAERFSVSRSTIRRLLQSRPGEHGAPNPPNSTGYR